MSQYGNSGPLAGYNSLLDKNLSGYFGNTQMRRHLVKSGLVSKQGHITSENAYRLKMAKKEHRKHVRDLLATAIVEKALDMERMRQHEIRKRLDELYKIELVDKVRSERGQKTNQELIALLSPRSTKTRSGKQRKTRSAAVTNAEKQNTRLPDIHFDEKTKRLYYENNDSEALPKPPRQHSHQPKKQNKTFPPRPPPQVKKKKKRKMHRGLLLAKSDQLIAHRVQLQSMAEITMKFLGSSLNLVNDMFPSNKLNEVQVIQQHCGASTVCVFRELLPANTVFTFISRRHRGSPLGLTININGIMNIRVSSCCEYKHKPGNRIGGKNSQFALVSVHGAAPCYRCQVRLNLLDNNKKEVVKEQENISSSDEEAAAESYDIIVSRCGKREHKHRDDRHEDRPVSANAMTQTSDEDGREDEEDEAVPAKDDYQDEEFEDEDKEFALKEDPLSSSDSSESESDTEEAAVSKEDPLNDTVSHSSDKGSDSEDESDRDDKESRELDTERNEEVEITTNNKIDEKSDSSDDDDKDGESSANEDHDDATDDKKYDSDHDSVSSISSKSSKSSIDSDSDKEKDKHEKSHSDLSDNADKETDDEKKSDDGEGNSAHDNENLDETDSTHSVADVKGDKEEDDDDLEEDEEETRSGLDINDSMPSVVSRESTMLTGNEYGDYDAENQTIQFNEEVDVVTYEKVDVEQSVETTPRSDDDDSDDDFDAVHNISERVMLADLGDDDYDDDEDIDLDDIERDIEKDKDENTELAIFDEGHNPDDVINKVADDTVLKERDVHTGSVTSLVDSWIDVELSNFALSPEQTDELLVSLDENSDEVESISLRNTLLNGGILKLKDVLKKAVNLKILNLNWTNMGPEEAVHLAEIISDGKHSIKVLMLHGNPLGDEGISTLVPSLSDSLTNLDIGECKISDQGALSIYTYLKDNSTVTNLTISGNNFTLEGWKHIANTLKENSSLTTLSVDNNNMLDEGVKILCEGIIENKSLISLDIEENAIEDSGGKALYNAIKECQTLIDVTLMPNNFLSQDIETAIRMFIQERVEKRDSMLT